MRMTIFICLALFASGCTESQQQTERQEESQPSLMATNGVLTKVTADTIVIGENYMEFWATPALCHEAHPFLNKEVMVTAFFTGKKGVAMSIELKEEWDARRVYGYQFKEDDPTYVGTMVFESTLVLDVHGTSCILQHTKGGKKTTVLLPKRVIERVQGWKGKEVCAECSIIQTEEEGLLKLTYMERRRKCD